MNRDTTTPGQTEAAGYQKRSHSSRSLRPPSTFDAPPWLAITGKTTVTTDDMVVETDLPCPWWSEDLLRREYVHRGRTKTEIAERWGCSTDTISYWLDKHGIDGGAR